MKKKVGKMLAVCMFVVSIIGTSALAADEQVDTSLAEQDSSEIMENIEETNFAMGYIPDLQEEIEKIMIDDEDAAFPMTTATEWESKVDLSTSTYFPYKIGNQGNAGACACFATAYYQYTYEVNRINKIPSTSDAALYSPRYIFNYLNGGKINRGTNLIDCYKTLAEFGCLYLSDFPYYNAAGVIDAEEWSTDTKKKREALNVRATDYEAFNIPADRGKTPITSPTDEDLNTVKEYLHYGKLLAVGSEFEWDSKVGYGKDAGKYIAYRCKKNWNGDNHSVVIVGYDDTIQCDVNGNGTIEAYEKGAFKAVNSWGTSFNQNGVQSSDGFFWIMYDALNEVSANQITDWESKCTGNRVTAFLNDNTFYAIFIKNKEVNFVGQLDVSTTNKNEMYLDMDFKKITDSQYKNSRRILPAGSAMFLGVNTYPYVGQIVFDYDVEPVKNYCNGYLWKIILPNAESLKKASYAITDNLGNEIINFGPLSTDKYNSPEKEISLTIGDVDYSRIVSSSDANMVLEYVVKKTDLSNVQKYLADVNGDKVINTQDAEEILKIVVKQ